MTLPAFALHQPRTLPEALEILAATPGAFPVAGGTCLLVDLRTRRRTADVLVDLSRLSELREIRMEDDALVLGAMATITDVLSSPLTAAHAPVLVAACRSFASPLVRHRATVGGNLSHGSPAADAAPPLLVMEAQVELVSSSRSRRLPMTQFFLQPCRTARRPDEILTSIRIPREDGRTHWAHEKLGLRKADAISVVSVAALYVVEEDCVRLAVGAVAPTPLRVTDAEQILHHAQLSPSATEQAAERAREAVLPIDDVRGSAAYRRRQVGVLTRRCLASLQQKQGGR
jgi:CO/xanthine dehydrogenase FAD-binding subunit